jgi:hypothetical protein
VSWPTRNDWGEVLEKAKKRVLVRDTNENGDVTLACVHTPMRGLYFADMLTLSDNRLIASSINDLWGEVLGHIYFIKKLTPDRVAEFREKLNAVSSIKEFRRLFKELICEELGSDHYSCRFAGECLYEDEEKSLKRKFKEEYEKGEEGGAEGEPP